MKNIFALFAFVLVSLGYSAATYSKAIQGNEGQNIPIFGSSSSTIPTPGSIINLDTSEVDTAYYFYDLLGKPVVSLTDTVGFISLAVKDSTGTDSAAARIVWYGNNRADGKGTWVLIDSVTKGPTASASSYANMTQTPVINSLGYMALMFVLKNPLHASVAQKCTVKDAYFSRRQRLMVR
jgi:hypothetical protein